MLPRIIFFTAVSLAILVVILLALLSPASHTKKPAPPWMDLSLYIQQPPPVVAAQSDAAGAFIFRRTLTEGPKNTSRVVGKAQGFIIPVEQFANSGFNIIYLTFVSPQYAGSVSVQAKHVGHRGSEQLTVVGGTGSFAFARGLAVFAETAAAGMQTPSSSAGVDATYRVKLQLRFPNQSHRTIPG